MTTACTESNICRSEVWAIRVPHGPVDAGEIDEFDIHVIPNFIGEGIPLVAPRHRDVPLRLRSARKYSDGVVRLRYEIAR